MTTTTKDDAILSTFTAARCRSIARRLRRKARDAQARGCWTEAASKRRAAASWDAHAAGME